MLRRADIALTDAKEVLDVTISFYRDLQNEETIKEMTIIQSTDQSVSCRWNQMYIYNRK